jgi:hypothetical protein
MSRNYPRRQSRQRVAGSGWLHTPVAGRLFYPPASTGELHDLMALGVRLR